ncbi:hypothetical protein F2Q69_00028117 [Brassica cretica]|uniref:Uncharacterized protein n=1 Tax=Brassica cretica TaxID=69181 RepID=A0A8S9S3G2_BRACR|nr:hypothetical protein F2Q69_00028117 [Brassica cretica]
MRKKEMLSLAIAYTYSVKLGKETKVLSLKLNRDKQLKDRTHEWGVKLVCSLPFSSKNIKSVDPEEEDVEEKDYENSDEEDGNHGVERYGSSSSSVFDFYASHSARDSGLPSANDVFSQVLYPQLVCIFVAFWLISRMKGSPFDDVNCVSTKESPAASAILILMFREWWKANIYCNQSKCRRSCRSLEVRAILLDPSCSGSGTITDRLDHLLPSHSAGSTDSSLCICVCSITNLLSFSFVMKVF